MENMSQGWFWAKARQSLTFAKAFNLTDGPGAGRAKLRLSRGFPRCLACDVTPYGMVDQSTELFMEGSRHKAG
jgi:hypothetical protein